MKETESHDTLGEKVIPSRYEIRIEPDFTTFEYGGEERIEVTVNESTERIAINAGELEIKRAVVRDGKGEQVARIMNDGKNERVFLGLGRRVAGKAEIEIFFRGYHNDKLYGFYRSRYLVGGKERYMLTTQLEPANARNAFPCFDEPAFKAAFDVSLIVDEKLSCISNMPVKEERKLGNGKKLVAFQTSPRMSTYLLYMGVGEFVRMTSRYRNMELGVVTTPGKEKYSKLALDYAARFLAYFERYFGIRYPLPKLDLIAVPDFSAGAMENWGAITFRETALLGDEKSSVTAKQRIAEVIAHEFVHQWFGDLVTMRWWNDLWLNESFANFMSYKALDEVMPEWEMMTQYIAGVVGTAFSADQLASTHPISVRVNTPEEIDQIFDEISYNKGGAVLRMIEGYVGHEAFRKGLNHYLDKNSYSNAEKYDLWNAIGWAASKGGKKLRVPEVARSWIDNRGYPAIEVRKTKAGLSLSQERFMLLEKEKGRTVWPIPLDIAYPQGGREVRTLMRGKELLLRNEGRSQPKLNSGQTGFYRTIYTKDMLDNLGEMIKSVEIGGRDAWGIENDMYALAKKRVYTLSDYLSFIDKYCFAARYPLNASVLSHLRGLFCLFYGGDERIAERIRELLRNYSAEVIKQVGWKRTPDETATTTLIRSAAILGSGISGERMTLNKANKLFKEQSREHAIDPNIRSAVYGLVAWSGNRGAYETLRSRYEREELPEEKIKLLASLGMFGDAGVLRRSLDYSLSKHVRYQDSYYIPAYVSSNPLGKRIIWQWTRRNWKVFAQRFKSGTHMLGRYIENVGAANDPKTMAELRRFFARKENMRSDLKNPLAETLEMMEINHRFASYNRKVWADEE